MQRCVCILCAGPAAPTALELRRRRSFQSFSSRTLMGSELSHNGAVQPFPQESFWCCHVLSHTAYVQVAAKQSSRWSRSDLMSGSLESLSVQSESFESLVCLAKFHRIARISLEPLSALPLRESTKVLTDCSCSWTQAQRR